MNRIEGIPVGTKLVAIRAPEVNEYYISGFFGVMQRAEPALHTMVVPIIEPDNDYDVIDLNTVVIPEDYERISNDPAEYFRVPKQGDWYLTRWLLTRDVWAVATDGSAKDATRPRIIVRPKTVVDPVTTVETAKPTKMQPTKTLVFNKESGLQVARIDHYKDNVKVTDRHPMRSGSYLTAEHAKKALIADYKLWKVELVFKEVSVVEYK